MTGEPVHPARLGPFEAVRELTFDAAFPRLLPVRQRFDTTEEGDVGDELEVLVLDEFGKDKSGSGMDTNVVGRMLIRDTPEPPGPRIANIVARHLTDRSHGNAAGIGLVDFVPLRVLAKIDLPATYINSVTAGNAGVQRGQLPIVLPSDRDAVAAAMTMSGRADADGLRLVRVRSTLELDELLVSESLTEEVERHPRLDVTGDPVPMTFAADGALT